MNYYSIRRWVFVTLLGGMFVLGFVSGSVSQRPAQAQIPGVGEPSARCRNSGRPSWRCSSMSMGSRKISRPSKKCKAHSVVANREARPRRSVARKGSVSRR